MICPQCKSHDVTIIHNSNLSARIAKIVCNNCGYALFPEGVTPPLRGQLSMNELLTTGTAEA